MLEARSMKHENGGKEYEARSKRLVFQMEDISLASCFLPLTSCFLPLTSCF